MRRTWRPTAWLYTHLLLAASLAAVGVGLEVAVSGAGHGAMLTPHRWLLVGSAAFAFLSMAMIQFASVSDPGLSAARDISLNRLVGIPFLVIIGLLSSLETQWVTVGILGVCVAQVIADISAEARAEADSLAAQMEQIQQSQEEE